MNVLAIDGALGGFSAAVLCEKNRRVTREIHGQVALEQGLSIIAAVLGEAGLAASDVRRLGVGIGPGSFTGARIAISYAKSLAQGWKVPLSAVDSFDAIEAGVALDGPRLTVVRGRAGVISARYAGAGQTWRCSGYVAEVLEKLGRAFPSFGRERVPVLGDAEDVLPACAERGWIVQKIARALEPAALAVAILAMQREPARTIHEVRADYGELPAARVPKRL